MAVEPDGVEPVYDLHQPDTHSFMPNGFVVHNCGEQCLDPTRIVVSVGEPQRALRPGWNRGLEALRQSVVTSTASSTM